jgi:hypothetical protein
MRRTYILLAIVLATALLFAVSADRAQSQTTSSHRICTATGLGAVVSGPCLTGLTCDTTTPALAKDFPRIVYCPAECDGAVIPGTNTPLSGTFLRWDYLFTGAAGTSPSLLGLQVSAEMDIVAALGGNGTMNNISVDFSAPCVGDSALQMGVNDCDSKWLKISGNCTATNPYRVSYFTGLGVKSGTEGASFKSGKIVGACAAEGASAPSCINPNSALYTDLIFTMPGCSVTYKVTPPPDCRAVEGSMTIVDGSCNISETYNMLVDGKEVLDMSVSCPVWTFTQPGSCSYCVPTTGGGKVCSTCTTCCVKKSTNTCVQKSTLSNPSLECTANSL